MKKTILICLLVLGLGVGTATAQFGSGIVFDPTNYNNALLRYYQLQQHLIELQKSYTQITNQLNLAMQMAAVHQEHARPLPRDVFPVAKRYLAQHLREHGLVD